MASTDTQTASRPSVSKSPTSPTSPSSPTASYTSRVEGAVSSAGMSRSPSPTMAVGDDAAAEVLGTTAASQKSSRDSASSASDGAGPPQRARDGTSTASSASDDAGEMPEERMRDLVHTCGRYWPKLSAQQRHAYILLSAQLIEKTQPRPERRPDRYMTVRSVAEHIDAELPKLHDRFVAARVRAEFANEESDMVRIVLPRLREMHMTAFLARPNLLEDTIRDLGPDSRTGKAIARDVDREVAQYLSQCYVHPTVVAWFRALLVPNCTLMIIVLVMFKLMGVPQY